MEPIIPDRLYRVFDDSSVSTYRRYGFRSPNQSFTVRDAEDAPFMWKPLRQHLDWSNRIPTLFLSTWDSGQKALETAIGREECGCQNVRIAVIEVDILEEEDIWFARLTDLVERFNVFPKGLECICHQGSIFACAEFLAERSLK